MTWNRGCMQSLQRHLRAGELAAVAAVIAATALSWGTLCLGEEGHVAFEVSIAGKCLDDVAGISAADSPAALSSYEGQSDCSPCTDLRAGSGQWLGSATSAQPDPGPAHVCVALAPIAMPLAGVAFFQIGAAPHLSTATTVLRC